MIYFDNAATGGFKPHAVSDAVISTTRYLLANPGRSGHRLSIMGAEIVSSARSLASEFFGASSDRVIFTKNCTEALNVAIFGTLKKGGHVITTIFEHNSVLRPLFTLEKNGLISLDVVSPESDKNICDSIEEKITPETYMIITTAVSNVTGEVLPVADIGALAKKHSLLYVVDGAQGGGHVRLDLERNNINILALAGHKGLYGIMGSGLLIFDENTEIEPLIYGGTGTETFNLSSALPYPESLEAGTLNLPAIASLKESLNYVKTNFTTFSEYLTLSSVKLLERLKSIDGITTYSIPNPAGIVSFSVNNYESNDFSDILNKEYDIAVRGGFHCAPLMHKFLGTDKSGLVRCSLAVQNSDREIRYFCESVKKILSR